MARRSGGPAPHPRLAPTQTSPTHAGYLELKEVFIYGGIMAVVSLLTWGLVGFPWWKLVGMC